MAWAKFQTSDDGSMFAFMTPEVDALNIVRSEIKIYRCFNPKNPGEILDLIKNKDYIVRYVEDEKMKRDLSFIDELIFDNKCQKLIGLGKTKFLVIDIESKKDFIYEI